MISFKADAVIFDMDGVLIDSEPLWKIAEKKAFKRVGLDMTTDMCNLTMGYRTSEVIEFWFRRHPWQGVTQEEMTNYLIDLVIEEIKEKGVIMKGVKMVLDHLTNKNIPIALASSSTLRIINTVLDKLQIRSYFRVIKSAEHEKYGKPHPAVFISAAEALGVHPSFCLVIEDSFNGVIAAKAAKMQVFTVPDPTSADDPKFIISDRILKNLDEFPVNIFQ